MKARSLNTLAFIVTAGAALACVPAQSQTQSGDADDKAYEETFDLMTATAVMTENCKGAITSEAYDTFKSVMRVHLDKMGAQPEDVTKFEETSVTMADYLCDDKSACWRSATDLPKTASQEEVAERCMDILLDATMDLVDRVKEVTETGS